MADVHILMQQDGVRISLGLEFIFSGVRSLIENRTPIAGPSCGPKLRAGVFNEIQIILALADHR